MAEKEDVKIPELFTTFENRLSDVLTQAILYGISRKQTDREAALIAVAKVYDMFYDVVVQAVYMQETIRLMHEIEEQKASK